MSDDRFESLLREVDVEADIGVPDQKKLQDVATLANELLVLETRLGLVAQEAERLSEQYKHIAEKSLPEAMKSAGMEEFKLTNGATVLLKEDMSLSVPKSNMHQVCGWLRENGHGDIIKHEVVVPVPKGKEADEKVIKLEAAIVKLKLEFSKQENVHSGTLKALLKEQRRKGVELDLKMFGAYEWEKAVVELPKTKSKLKQE